MLFDFDRFTTSVKLAYRRCGGSAYGLEDVLRVFRYYFDTYEYIIGEVHPVISISQIVSIIEKMPTVLDEDEFADPVDITPDDYECIIDQHFITKYMRCDYNINHFFSGQIRDLRYLETCY